MIHWYSTLGRSKHLFPAIVPLMAAVLWALPIAQGHAVQTCLYDSIASTAPAAEFIDHGDGTVTHSRTGLMWKKCLEGLDYNNGACVTGAAADTYSWQGALQLAAEHTYAGHDDWRLPNIKEGTSILEFACKRPALDLAVFPEMPSTFDDLWTATPEIAGLGAALYVDFGGSGFYSIIDMTITRHVRLVRGPDSVSTVLNDTGVYWWDDYRNQRLDSEPVDYPGQDASFGRDITNNSDTDGNLGFSFTKVDSYGYALDAGAVDWACVKDQVTGLVWEVKTNDGGVRDRDYTYTWYDTDPATNGGSAGTQGGGSCTGSLCDTENYAGMVNTAGLCAANDWRIPSYNELLSIVDFGVDLQVSGNLPVDLNWFPWTVNERYWTATPYSGAAGSALVISFANGGDLSLSKSTWVDVHVRLVRDGAEESLPLAPDLVLLPPQTSPEALLTGAGFAFSVTAYNQGSADSSATTMRIYRSSDNIISAGDTLLDTSTVNILGLGRTADKTVYLTAPSDTGNAYYYACLDSSQQENNTENNCSSVVALGVTTMSTIDCQPGPVTISNTDYHGEWVAQSQTTLETSGSVDINTDAWVAFVAGEEINLKPGFHVHADGQFSAHIGSVNCAWN